MKAIHSLEDASELHTNLDCIEQVAESNIESIITFVSKLNFQIEESDLESFLESLENVLENEQSDIHEELVDFFIQKAEFIKIK